MSAANPLHGFDATQVKPPAASEQRAYEPSMEEILASIRRIIADDQSLPNRAAPHEESSVTNNGHVSAAGENQGQAPQAAQAPQASQAQPTDPFTETPASVTMLHQVLQGRRTDATSGSPAADHGSSVPDAGPAMPPDPDMQEHGRIAAPQFASPAGPARHPDEQTGHYDHATPYDADTQGDLADDGAFDGQVATALFSTATDKSVTGAFNTLAAMRLADNSEDLLGLARDMIRPLLKTWLDNNLPGMVERMVRAEIERVARGGR